MISVSIVSFNEADKLNNCLKSVADFADEIVVLDLNSSDGTQKICQKYKAKIFKHRLVPFVELIRNDAISKTNEDWILVLDPDEQLGDSLKKRLKEIIKDDKYDAVNIPRKNIFFGHWISHTNWWPDRQIRFFKKGKVEWSDKIHVYPKVSGKILNLETKEDLAITHFGYESVTLFLDRQNRYSTVEAENLYQEGARFSWKLFFWKPAREFLVRFVSHLGFLDGFHGFALTFLMMIYQLQVMIKLWERQKK